MISRVVQRAFASRVQVQICRTLESSVHAQNACVSSDQLLASKAGIEILKLGGNAADAAVAMSAVIGVMQPMAGGIGGDSYCLFYKSSDHSVHGLNSSGRSAAGLTLEKVKKSGFVTEPIQDVTNGLWVNVPGAVAGMFDCIHHFGSGKLSMGNILAPAIKVAEDGFPVTKTISFSWENSSSMLKSTRHGKDLLLSNGTAPKAGDIMYAKNLAQCLKAIAKDGAESFYKGPIAERIVKEVQYAGGCLTMEDMSQHLETSYLPELPLFVDFHGFRLWEMGANTIGVIALYALKILEEFDLRALGHNSAEYIHIVGEAIKLSYSDCWEHLCDQEVSRFPFEKLFSTEHIAQRRSSIHRERALKLSEKNAFVMGGNTSYVAAVDADGNSCSFIFSVSSSFGCGQVPEDCGFPLHDRGRCFSLDPKSHNVFGPRKRSLHTIIPAILTDLKTKELIATFGVVGRWMQPQGHVQVLLNMLIFGMDPQKALNQPRFFVGNPNCYVEYRENLHEICLEDGILPSVASVLEGKGHKVISGKDVECATSSVSSFGRGHVIAKPVLWKKDFSQEKSSVWYAGADPRCDGIAIGY